MDAKNDNYIRTRLSAGTGSSVLTPDTPLTPQEQLFVAEYMRSSKGVEALKAAGVECPSHNWYVRKAHEMLNKPNVRAEIERIMNEIRKETIADGTEVMSYFTSVMRGDIKDQFGLDASLAERTRAAQELAKRTVDIENRRKGIADQVTEIKLDWSRN